MTFKRVTVGAIPCAILSLLVSLAGGGNVDAAPANDAFVNPTVVDALPYNISQDTTGATLQAGEPNPCSTSNRTVWYRFTPSTSGLYIVDTFGSSFDTVLSVYTGSQLTSLTPVGCSDDTLSSNRSRVELQATQGTTYSIQAGGFMDQSGTLWLNVRPAPPPPANDHFADAITVGALPFGNSQYNFAATEDVGEPLTTCSDVQRTVWYRFTPPSTGTYVIDTAASDLDTVLSVFTGTLGNLTQIACNDDIGMPVLQSRVQPELTGGVTYYIQAGGFSGYRGGEPADYGTLVTRVTMPVAAADTDGDGCTDLQEAGTDPLLGGDRDPTYFWDFFDVDASRAIDLSDAVGVLAHFGEAPGDPGYDPVFDRYAPDPDKPHRTAAATGTHLGVTLADALVNLSSFGNACTSEEPPLPTPTTAPPTATSTPTGTNTPGPSATVTQTPTPTATNTPVPSATSTRTPTPTVTNTPTPSATSTRTPTATVTNTPAPSATSTRTPTATVTNTPAPSRTPTRTATPTATNTPGLCIDTDGDGLCNILDLDDDNDYCPDERETGTDPTSGGGRDPLNKWDFFDVTQDGLVNLNDSLSVLGYFGDAGLSPEGNLRDRYVPNSAFPWRSAEGNDGVDLMDVLASLNQFGHSCVDSP